MPNYFTIDIEEPYCLYTATDIDKKTSQKQLEEAIERLTTLLNKYFVRATFFVLGEFAEKYPEIVMKLSNEGHEIASHGYRHRHLSSISKSDFIIDIEKSVKVLNKLSKNRIIGYRAPYFSLNNDILWVTEILKDMGFVYSSSVYPIKYHPNYGMRDISLDKFTHQSGLWEFPMTSVKIYNQLIPCSGGAYFRFYPFWLTNYLLSKRKNEIMFYIHPWEIMPGHLSEHRKLIPKIRHYYGISNTIKKLDELFSKFKFTNIASNFTNEL